MQRMHKTPSLWTRAGVPCIFGHDMKQITEPASLLCALCSAYTDPSSEDIWKEQHLSMQLWAILCTD